MGLTREGLAVLDPVGDTRFSQESDLLAERAATLDGKVVGFLDDNAREGSRDYFARFEELIRERFEPREVRHWTKPLKARPYAEEVIEEVAAQCDVAILGTCI